MKMKTIKLGKRAISDEVLKLIILLIIIAAASIAIYLVFKSYG